jgi:hypothetical protein
VRGAQCAPHQKNLLGVVINVENNSVDVTYPNHLPVWCTGSACSAGPAWAVWVRATFYNARAGWVDVWRWQLGILSWRRLRALCICLIMEVAACDPVLENASLIVHPSGVAGIAVMDV